MVFVDDRPQAKDTRAAMNESDSGAATAAAQFEEVALPWLGDVRRFAYRLTGEWPDADDLTQTTYLNALRGWRTFRLPRWTEWVWPR